MLPRDIAPAIDAGTTQDSIQDTATYPVSFRSYNNIRRLYGTTLRQDFVFDALVSAGFQVENAVHKQGTSQSHGRWEVKSAVSEVHLGYEGNRAPPQPLVDTIVQGSKGWTKAELDRVAAVLEAAHAADDAADVATNAGLRPRQAHRRRKRLKK